MQGCFADEVRSLKIAFHTLGCRVNQYESEAMAKIFISRGHEVVGEKDFADAYIINTCTVTAVADKKSRQYIRRMKKINPDSVIAVTGCYAQISPEEVEAIDGVDIVTGTNEKRTLAELVEKAIAKSADSAGKVLVHRHEDLGEFEELGIVASVENRTRAYIKIQEGCNRFCTYCVIPYARGPVRSRKIEDIVAEAEALLKAGYKELVLTGINTAQYDMEGRDLYNENQSDSGSERIFGVEKAIAAISRLPGDFRIRLGSLEPAVVNSDYVKRLFRYDKLCHHLHMSVQSGSDCILQAMNRPYRSDQYYQMVRTLFDFDPCYGISTDIIVGFPGERGEDFAGSCALVTKCGFCKTHVFKYSRRPLTKAAEMKGQVSPQVKNRRSDKLQEVAGKAADGFFKINLAAADEGRRERVLIEGFTDDLSSAGTVGSAGGRYLTGYTGNYIRTYIDSAPGNPSGIESPENAKLLLNCFLDVRLIEIFRDGMKGIIV